MMLSRCSICNNIKSTFVSQGSGIFDCLIYNTRQNRMKDDLCKDAKVPIKYEQRK